MEIVRSFRLGGGFVTYIYIQQIYIYTTPHDFTCNSSRSDLILHKHDQGQDHHNPKPSLNINVLIIEVWPQAALHRVGWTCDLGLHTNCPCMLYACPP